MTDGGVTPGALDDGPFFHGTPEKPRYASKKSGSSANNPSQNSFQYPRRSTKSSRNAR